MNDPNLTPQMTLSNIVFPNIPRKNLFNSTVNKNTPCPENTIQPNFTLVLSLSKLQYQYRIRSPVTKPHHYSSQPYTIPNKTPYQTIHYQLYFIHVSLNNEN